MYKYLFKPVLFLLNPDFIHKYIVATGRVVQQIGAVRWLLRKLWRYDSSRLTQRSLGLEFTNPVGLSAGFDKNIELQPLMESVGFGFITGGSITLKPRVGNQHPWFYRLPHSRSVVVNAGMPNRGVKVIAKNVVKNIRSVKDNKLVISIAAVPRSRSHSLESAIDDVKSTMLYIIRHNLATAIEINISCPNVGTVPFSEPEALHDLLQGVDTIKRKVPVIIKMPLLSTTAELDALLCVIVRHNIQAVTIANLIKDRSAVTLNDELPETVRGGLSGQPTRQLSLQQIRYVYEHYGDHLVIIGVGGIFTAEDAYEKIQAGASLVAMVTGLFYEGPQVVGKINRGIERLLMADGFESIAEAVGSSTQRGAILLAKKSENLSKKSCKTRLPAV